MYFPISVYLLISGSDEFVQALNFCISNSFDMCDYFDVPNEILQYKILSILNNEDKYNKIRNDFIKRMCNMNLETVDIFENSLKSN